ncbi:MAG: class I SAM-dependent methyltransferase [Bacteroidota bacterium]|nr:class I SAM-dependent methyltransferase [Bacteroidota bacterium]
MVTAVTNGNNIVGHDYSDFGDYLFDNELKNTEQYVNTIIKERKPFFDYLKKRYGNNLKLLDIGSGAGYFLMAAKREGIDAYGVEISKKLRSFSLSNFPNVKLFDAIQNVTGSFHVVTMFDVIEHFPSRTINSIIDSVYNFIEPDGLFLGNTPNIDSINIKLHGGNDPVISPPVHLCYFSTQTLNKLLVNHGFIKEKIGTRGLSTNSFFRPRKDEYSFLEYPLKNYNLFKKIMIIGIKLFFKSIGFMMRITPWGYNLYFRYRKPTQAQIL